MSLSEAEHTAAILIQRAQLHGEESDPDHEVGDLQEALTCAIQQVYTLGGHLAHQEGLVADLLGRIRDWTADLKNGEHTRAVAEMEQLVRLLSREKTKGSPLRDLAIRTLLACLEEEEGV